MGVSDVHRKRSRERHSTSSPQVSGLDILECSGLLVNRRLKVCRCVFVPRVPLSCGGFALQSLASPC